MRKPFRLISAALLLMTLSITATAQRLVDTPVTVNIDGLGLDTAPMLRIQSDQLGAYKNATSKNSGTLQSVIQGIGDWELDMLNFSSSPQRTVLIDLRDPVAASAPGGVTPAAPFAPELVRARFIAKCTEYGGNMLKIVGVGTSITCPLAVRFDQGGRGYRLTFNYNNFPNVDPVTVTCVAVADPANPYTSACKQWKVEPSVIQADGERKSRAKLIRLASSRKETDQDMGDFYLSFTINVTKP